MKKLSKNNKLIICLTGVSLLVIAGLIIHDASEVSPPEYIPVSAMEDAHHIFQDDERVLHLTTISPEVGFETGLKEYPKLTWETETIKESSPRISINMEYPQFKGGEVVDKLNKHIKWIIDSNIEEDREMLKELVKEEPDYFSSSLDIASHYRVRGATKGIASVEIVITDFTGGGAGNHSRTVTINWDLKANSSLKLAEEFFCDENYMDTLVPLVREQLIYDFAHSPYIRQPLDDATKGHIMEGTEPTSDNLHYNYLLSKDGLIVVFDPYQVASGSGGIIRTLIPYSAIPTLLCLQSII